MTTKQLEFLLLVCNKSSYKEKEFENDIKWLVDNRYLYRKNGFINLTEKAKEFVQRQTKEKYDPEDVVIHTDFLGKLKMINALQVAADCEKMLYKMIAKARGRNKQGENPSS